VFYDCSTGRRAVAISPHPEIFPSILRSKLACGRARATLNCTPEAVGRRVAPPGETNGEQRNPENYLQFFRRCE